MGSSGSVSVYDVMCLTHISGCCQASVLPWQLLPAGCRTSSLYSLPLFELKENRIKDFLKKPSISEVVAALRASSASSWCLFCCTY